MKNFKKKINSWWFLARFYVYTVIMLVPKLPYLKYLTKKGQIEKRTEKVFAAIHKWADYSVRIGKSTVTVNGLEKIPRDRPVLFIPNHQSYADIPMLIYALKGFNFGFMLKISVTNIPFIGSYLKYMYCVAVDHADMRQAAQALRDTAEVIGNGYSLVIFPEGKRSFSNTPAEFKNGAFKLVRKTGVTIVPIYLHNVHLVYEGNERRIAPANVSVNVLDPIETAEMTRADVNALNERVYNIIADYAKNYGEDS